MNLEQLKKLIWDEENDCISDIYSDFLNTDVGFKKEINGAEFEMALAEGGYEGAGENVKRVFKVEDTFWQVVGGYCSYSGIEWDNRDEPDQVFPKQKTVTVYE